MSVLAVVALPIVLGARVEASPDDQHRSVRVAAAPAHELQAASTVVDGVRDGEVLDVFVTAGVGGARGFVRQCARTVDGVEGCSRAFPVLFDEHGVATLQYEVVDTGGCDAGGRCVLVVGDSAGERVAVAALVFGEAALAAPGVAISPSGLHEAAEPVEVRVTGLRAGTAVDVAFCAQRCGTSVRLSADGSGAATARLTIGERCESCSIVVVGGPHRVVRAVEYASAPGPSYDRARLVAGLAAAAAFLLLATWIARAVDWRPPSEAGTPDLDVAEL